MQTPSSVKVCFELNSFEIFSLIANILTKQEQKASKIIISTTSFFFFFFFFFFSFLHALQKKLMHMLTILTLCAIINWKLTEVSVEICFTNLELLSFSLKYMLTNFERNFKLKLRSLLFKETVFFLLLDVHCKCSFWH